MKRIVLVLAGVALVAGCSGVPSSSEPETVRALDTGQASNPPAPPDIDKDPLTIVRRFQEANATTTRTHPVARAYLTKAANDGWLDNTATIIADDFSINPFNLTKHTVTIFGRVLGRLTADGIYTPSLDGDGEGGDKVPFTFRLTQVGSEWKIANLHSGLLISDDQFRETYHQQALYFFDLSGTSLVPDLRWTALEDKAESAQWLLGQLVSGPRPELQSAVSADTMPAQVDPQQIRVELGSPTLIEIPGSNQLAGEVRDRLAAQLGQTLQETLAGRKMSITDGGAPVPIPRINNDEFTAADFATAFGPPIPSPGVYYLEDGRIRDDTGRPLAGAAGDGSYYLNSFAIGRAESNGPLLIAGVTGSGHSARLYVGTQHGGLEATSAGGTTSRPAFVPARNEAWIGAGDRLFRVRITDSGPRVDQIPILSGGGIPIPSGGGQILALRLSPEGARIAIVISGGNGVPQLYVGSIVRGTGSPRVDNLTRISPDGVAVEDVAWLDSFKLFAIGYLVDTEDARTFEAGVDGTDWTNATTGNLPDPPDSVAAATASSVWVSENGFVWKQSGSSWVSPGPTGQTPGTAPAYLE